MIRDELIEGLKCGRQFMFRSCVAKKSGKSYKIVSTKHKFVDTTKTANELIDKMDWLAHITKWEEKK